MTVGAEVAAGSAKGAWTGATIKFNNKATNQDQCKGATVNLDLHGRLTRSSQPGGERSS